MITVSEFIKHFFGCNENHQLSDVYNFINVLYDQIIFIFDIYNDTFLILIHISQKNKCFIIKKSYLYTYIYSLYR